MSFTIFNKIKNLTYLIISCFSLKKIFSLLFKIELYSSISERSTKPNPLEILLNESYIILQDTILLNLFFKKERSSSSFMLMSKFPI